MTQMVQATLKANSLTTLQQTIAQLKTKKVLLLLWEFAHISDAHQHIDQSLVQLILVETVGKAGFIAHVMAQSLTLQEEFMQAYLLQPT